LYAFDLLELNGTDLRREPIEVRKRLWLASYARAGQECASTNTLSILTVMSFFTTPARLEPRASCPNGSARATGPAARRIGLSSKTRRPLL
jgi:hypothetical protein